MTNSPTPCPIHVRELPCARCYVEEIGRQIEAVAKWIPQTEPECKEIERLLKRLSHKLSCI